MTEIPKNILLILRVLLADPLSPRWPAVVVLSLFYYIFTKVAHSFVSIYIAYYAFLTRQTVNERVVILLRNPSMRGMCHSGFTRSMDANVETTFSQTGTPLFAWIEMNQWGGWIFGRFWSFLTCLIMQGRSDLPIKGSCSRHSSLTWPEWEVLGATGVRAPRIAFERPAPAPAGSVPSEPSGTSVHTRPSGTSVPSRPASPRGPLSVAVPRGPSRPPA